MSEHTATPWILDACGVIWAANDGKRSRLICAMARPMQIPEVAANASFILRACNSHHDLLEALEWAEAALDAAWKVCEIRGDSAGAGHLRIALSKSRAALKKAKP